MEYLSVCQTAQGQTDGELRVQYWPDATDAQKYTVYTENLKDITLIEDGAAVALVFAPAGVSAPLPPSVGAPITDVPGGVLQGPPTTQP